MVQRLVRAWKTTRLCAILVLSLAGGCDISPVPVPSSGEGPPGSGEAGMPPTMAYDVAFAADVVASDVCDDLASDGAGRPCGQDAAGAGDACPSDHGATGCADALGRDVLGDVGR